MMRCGYRTIRLLAATLAFVPLGARAQTSPFGPGKAVGVTIQAIRIDEEVVPTPVLALHISSFRSSGFVVDGGVATVPIALAYGFVILAPDIGIGYAFPVGGGALMLKGGPTAVFAVPAEGGAVVGVHIGAVGLVRLGNTFGLRAEVVPRFYAVGGGTAWLTTFGIGFTSLPARHR